MFLDCIDELELQKFATDFATNRQACVWLFHRWMLMSLFILLGAP